MPPCVGASRDPELQLQSRGQPKALAEAGGQLWDAGNATPERVAGALEGGSNFPRIRVTHRDMLNKLL